jgi:type III pantothenate kinase
VATFKENQLIDKDILKYSDLVQYLKLRKFKKGIISNVGNEILEQQVLEIYPSIISMSHDFHIPIKSNYLSMNTIGKDRLANAVGAFTENPDRNSLVIDAGSCLTFDFIDSKNCYLGGSISPGLSMRFNSLHKFTEKLPLLNEESSNLKLIGSDTKSSIVSGVVNGFCSEITTLISNYRSRYKLLTIFMTGGDWRFIKSIVEVEKNGIFANENLTMLGLNTILNYNDK